ncbi:hypothetical protein ScPMuIL_016906 [Solemya velum]
MLNIFNQPTTSNASDLVVVNHQARRKFSSSVDAIIQAGNDISREMNKTAYYHMMGDQIKQGHFHLKWLKNRIILLATLPKTDLSLVRKLIGQYLYTMQSFYSSTNWVEDKGKDVYEVLGTNQNLYDVAKTNVSTCTNCVDKTEEVKKDSCKGNIIKTNPFRLTSAYLYGQDVEKSLKFLNTGDVGKCSYGGALDGKSSKFPGKGGINKDTKSPKHSPHYMYHQDAVDAAIKATEHFLMDSKYGLVASIGLSTMQKILQVYPQGPIIFIIDVTHGMDSHFQSMKDPLTERLKNLESEFKPKVYVVANITDADDKKVQGINTTEKVDDAVKWIKGLHFSGGGDFPEHQFTAMENTLKSSHAGKMARVFVFTDSGAHDYNKTENLTKLAKSINAKIDIIYFGSVEARRRRDVSDVEFLLSDESSNLGDREKREVTRYDEYTIYKNVTDQTSGLMIPAAKNKGGSFLQILKFMETEMWPPGEASIMESSLKTGCELSFPVDSYLKYLRIKIKGAKSSVKITLKNHLQNTFDFEKEARASKIYLGDNTHILQVKQPTPGKFWHVKVDETEECTIKVTGHSGLEFKYLLVKSGEPFFYPMSGSPIIGGSYAIVLSLNNLKDGKVNSVILRDVDGKTNSYNAKTYNSSRETIYHAKVIIPDKNFTISITGTDDRDLEFRRLSDTKVVPSPVLFTLLPYNADLMPNKQLKLKFNLTDMVDGGDYKVTIKTTPVLETKVVMARTLFSLSKGKPVTQEMTITGDTDTELVKLEISVSKSNSYVVLQKHVEVLLTTAAAARPTCEVREIGSCDKKWMFQKNCSSASWEGSVRFTAHSGAIKEYLLGNADIENVKVSSKSWGASNVEYTLKASCCNPNVYITGVSSDGSYAQCKLELSGGQKIAYDIPVDDELTELEILIIAIVCSLAFIIILSIIIFVVWWKSKHDGGDDFDLNFG